ncbi:restriction endonuclease subunit S [Methylicorpusculum sp.]|uniref:restriction endonuclease subunit S n=1 Tax=Methylicorpusculum sp. TaxID=2713644 RepID=UPI0027187D66|nr:restriction endonuclease subunit S [Methylicorpusculum sp.]MDO8843530.1 restriction endonuclease subunit S [Methylicorpusculum sp.]
MDAQQFLAEFGHIANAPGGLVRLREMVLALAVQGRLIAQDSNDSPASELLKNITAGKRDVSNNSKSKLPNTLSKISTSDMPFEKPQGWEWVRLGDIAEIERGGSPRPIDDFLTNDPDGLSWIKIGDTIKGSKFITSTREKIKKEGLVKTRMVYPGDFLLTNSMSFGRPYITNIEGCIHDGWLRIHPPSCLEKDYLYHLLSSPFVANFFLKSAAGAVVQNLNADKVRELPVPLPPLDEQARIVAKVDELMALCDRLEQQQQQRRKLQNALRQSMLQAVATATSPHELQTTWTSLANNFGQLFSAPDDVVGLRNLLLDLAIRGFLTEQKDVDTPALVTFEEIKTIEQKLLQNKRTNRPKSFPKLQVDDLPFDIPKNWLWTRLGELAPNFQNGISKRQGSSGDSITVLRLADIANNKISLLEPRSIQLNDV